MGINILGSNYSEAGLDCYLSKMTLDIVMNQNTIRADEPLAADILRPSFGSEENGEILPTEPPAKSRRLDIQALLRAEQGRNYDLHTEHINPAHARTLKTIGFDRCYVRAE